MEESELRRYRNLKMFKGYTDEQILEYLDNRPPKAPVETAEDKALIAENPTTPYDRRFKYKLKQLQKEYAIDMNNANDAESLKSLVRFSLQLEVIDQQIRSFYENKRTNTKELKDMGDYQRSLQMSIGGLQTDLGINRKTRKESQVDDIPKYIEALKEKALNLWERSTVPIRCQKDEIELGRYWLNFPKLNNTGIFELECWKCHEKVLASI